MVIHDQVHEQHYEHVKYVILNLIRNLPYQEKELWFSSSQVILQKAAHSCWVHLPRALPGSVKR
jgi:hypothetical protein